MMKTEMFIVLLAGITSYVKMNWQKILDYKH